MENLSTELGKIYCRYNSEIDDFDKIRVISIVDDKDNKTKLFGMERLDNSYNHVSIAYFSEEEYNDIRKNWTQLKSDGIISCTDIVAVRNKLREIKDILLIYFPNNKMTKIPDAYNPYIVARQGINNIFAEMAGEQDIVGMSVSIDTLPPNYALKDFMGNTKVLSSNLTHVYRIDTPESIARILDTKEEDEILKELYTSRVHYKQNIGALPEDYDLETVNDCVDGYCNSLERFITESGFYEDLLLSLNITPIDFTLEENKPLSLDDKLVLATLCGGNLKIDKAVPLKFDYDIDMASVKMKYLLARKKDGTEPLYIIPYTESPEEIDAKAYYNLTEERTIKLQERLMNCVKAWDESKGYKSYSGSDISK